MFTSHVHIDEIQRRISDFRERAKAGMPDSDLVNAITAIFGDVFSYAGSGGQYPKGTKFVRARPIPDDDSVVPLRSMSHVGDAWEKPDHLVDVQGRLNSVGQGVLYCCPVDVDLAIDEARARGNRRAAVMVYQATRPVSVAILGNYENSTLAKDDMSRLFYGFLDEEFSQEVTIGNESRYSITRAIADSFFNYPEQDAWCYRSVQSRDKFNVAFLPGRQKTCLELSGVLICDLHMSSPGAQHVVCVVDFDPDNGSARYHVVGSEAQKRIFPEIV